MAPCCLSGGTGVNLRPGPELELLRALLVHARIPFLQNKHHPVSYDKGWGVVLKAAVPCSDKHCFGEEVALRLRGIGIWKEHIFLEMMVFLFACCSDFCLSVLGGGLTW